MDYREIAPPPALMPFVARFWTLRGTSDGASYDLVLPDGHAELVVHRTGRFRQCHASGEITEQPRAIIAGVMDTAVALAPPVAFETLEVRFTPLGLAPLCRHGVGPRLSPAEGLLSAPGARLVADLAQADSVEEALCLLCRGLARIYARVPPLPPRLSGAVTLIQRTGGRITIDEVLRRTGAPARWLERRFHEAIGLPPKRYARIVRFQRAVGALVSGREISGAALALRHGYYDQAHFTSEFKAFTGCAPRAFVAGQLGELTRHFASDSYKTRLPAPGDSGRGG